MKSLHSSISAALVAPWVVVPIVALAMKGRPLSSQLELIAGGAAMGVLFAVPLAYLAVLLVGYPAYKVLLRYGRLNAWSLCLVGCIAGGIGGYIFVGSEGVVLNAFCGLAVAGTAWLFIRRELKEHISSEHGRAES